MLGALCLKNKGSYEAKEVLGPPQLHSFVCVTCPSSKSTYNLESESVVEKLSSFKLVSPFSQASNLAREFWHHQSDALHDKTYNCGAIHFSLSLVPRPSPRPNKKEGRAWEQGSDFSLAYPENTRCWPSIEVQQKGASSLSHSPSSVATTTVTTHAV